jgi:hypothetical protein
MQKISEKMADKIGNAIYELDWSQKSALETVNMMYEDILLAVYDNQFKSQRSVWNLSRRFASVLDTLIQWHGV